MGELAFRVCNQLHAIHLNGLTFAQPVHDLFAQDLTNLRAFVELGLLRTDQPGCPTPRAAGLLKEQRHSDANSLRAGLGIDVEVTACLWGHWRLH